MIFNSSGEKFQYKDGIPKTWKRYTITGKSYIIHTLKVDDY